MKNESKIILDLCGGTGAWSKPYQEAGYDVRVITLPRHSVFSYEPPNNVYGILAAPPCTEFSFAKSNSKYPRDMEKGMRTVKACLEIIWKAQYNLPTPLAKRTSLKFWALENPYGLLNSFLGKETYRFCPSEFGETYRKITCVWGKFTEPVKTHQRGGIDKDFLRDVSDSDWHQVLSSNGLSEFNLFNENGYAPDLLTMSKRSILRSITPSGFARQFFLANQ